jgi:tetratricopeptide (TPR) repeat protein
MLLLGVLAYEAGEHQAAARHIAKAVELEARYDTPAYHEAVTAHNAGHYRKALALFKELASTNPTITETVFL